MPCRLISPGFALSAALLAVAACGNTTVNVPTTPRMIPGGGLGDGPIAGTLNVYVIDDDTKAPVSGAAVRVGGSAEPSPCMVNSDSTGLAVFERKTCMLLTDKQSVTVSATGYSPTTWIGVNATNLTMSIRAITPAVIDTATITGTITGWDMLPPPAAQHQTLALIGYSGSRTLGDAANNLTQDKRTVTVPLIGDVMIDSNVCVRNALVNDCNWRLKTRTGAQAHYAVVLDQDTKGTTNNDADDTFTVIGWAIKTGLTFSKDNGADGEALTLLADADMQPFSTSFPTPPSGLDYIGAFPMLDLGDEGRIAIVLPALNLTNTSTRVPKLAGALGSGKYDFFAKAQDAKDKDLPSTLSWAHAIDATTPVTALNWLLPPTGITATGGTYSFTAVLGATLHGAELQTMDGKRAWSVTIFDGSTSFTLPGVSPDPLPTGMARLAVSALVVPDFNLTNAKFDDLQEKLTHISSDQIMFMH
jgi:hypothetical protein